MGVGLLLRRVQLSRSVGKIGRAVKVWSQGEGAWAWPVSDDAVSVPQCVCHAGALVRHTIRSIRSCGFRWTAFPRTNSLHRRGDFLAFLQMGLLRDPCPIPTRTALPPRTAAQLLANW